jgi:hypothetical protein
VSEKLPQRQGFRVTAAVVLYQVAWHYTCDHGLAALKDKQIRDLSRSGSSHGKKWCLLWAIHYILSDLHRGNCKAFGEGKLQWEAEQHMVCPSVTRGKQGVKDHTQKYYRSRKEIKQSSSSSTGTTTLVGFRPAQLPLSILSRKVLQSAVASGTSNPQLGGEPGI